MTREGEHQKDCLDAKGQHNVLHQHLRRRTRQTHEGRNLAQVIVHQGHVGGFNGGICACRSHCKANVRTRQGRCVVDAITDHANLAISGQLLHFAQFVVRQLVAVGANSNQLPDDKLREVEQLSRNGKVGMVGDGINDAPALARADIGFAMGAAGTDTAIETADVALMDDDLRKIPTFVRLSRATAQVLMQNIVLALGIKAVFLVLTFTGHATMWMAVFADMGASLLVVGNGLRLLRR